MEMKSPAACPNTVTVRRNPPRRARTTPSSHIPLPLPLSSSTPSSTSKDIPSFPIEDILSIQVLQNPSNKPEEPIAAENLRVFLRIKPLSTSSTNQTLEKTSLSRNRKNVWPQNPNTKHNNNASKTKPKKKAEVCLQKNDSHSVTLCPPLNLQDQKRSKSEVYEGFSFVFSADSSQDEVYEKMVDPLVEDFLRGKSGMLAALGPSGSGKTHTIFGTARQPGMIPLALRRIFSGNEGSGAQPSRTFYLSMFEICSERGKSERILDLCRDGSDVCIQQSNIKGLQEAESLIAMGMVKRSTATTNSNNQSSRSQCIINIRCDTDDNANALLTIVDLAGAEREKRTGNQGARLLESNFINNTSMVFGLCLRSLLEHQKNRKKPLQKHFQNSLLTRYLREYLEGKKRMALILTIKSGEEDYVDASFLLRHASPYMKIKFSNSEEPSDAIGNKRQFQTSIKPEQVKRLKVNEGKTNGTSTAFDKDDHSKESMKSEVYEDTSCNELLNRDRQNQITISFAKATWKVLKQYKEKLKVAEKEICCLKEKLILEKTRSSELEVELNHFKSHYSSCENKEEGAASSVNLSECEFTENLQNSNHPSYQVNRRSDDLEDLTGIEISSSSVEGCQFQGEAEEAAETSCVNLNGSDFIESLQNSNPAVSRPAVVSNSCSNVKNFEEQRYNENMRSEDLEDPTVIELSSSLVEGDQFQCEADEVAETSSVNLNTSGFIENMQISNPSVSCSSVVSNLCIDVENFKEYSYPEDPKRRGNSSLPVERDHLQCVADEKLLDQPRRSKEDLKRTNLCNVDDASEVSISPVSYPKPQIAAEKPKRRLQPASSILLKSISGLGIEEENEKPKGTRGDKKIGLDVTKRTQGSMSLLRLLKDNLYSGANPSLL